MIEVKIIADSISPAGKRLTTMQLKYPRFLLAQLNTHRVFSRSTASSRAIPTLKLLEQVELEPVLPEFWGKNQAGMQAESEIDPAEIEVALQIWQQASQSAANHVRELLKYGVHKQLVNRLLEPFLHAQTVVTATEWDNFFQLRCHHDSQPEMQVLACAMRDAMNASKPEETIYHLPYITQEDKDWADRRVRHGYEWYDLLAPMSAARCARVSYLKHDGQKPTVQSDLELASKLESAKHCFTEGTEVLTKQGWVDFSQVTFDTEIAAFNPTTTEWLGYEKPTDVINQGYTGTVYEWNSPFLQIGVTEHHKLVGVVIGKKTDRKLSYESAQIFMPSGMQGKSTRTFGEREMIMFSAPKPRIPTEKTPDFYLGALLGFFLGDGYADGPGTVCFRLKLPRKITYITNILRELDLPFSTRMDRGGVTNIRSRLVGLNWKDFYNQERRKCIPERDFNSDQLYGLFDGLKNSDGSIKRNTWVYDTCSKQLAEQILGLCPLVGLTGVINPATCYQEKGLYRISFMTNNHIRLNDPRTPESHVQIKYYEGKVYCVEIPSSGIMVRKNGRTLFTHNCSPFEHQAKALRNPEERSGNFFGWEQQRQLVDKGV